jgi:hypothetical protein
MIAHEQSHTPRAISDTAVAAARDCAITRGCGFLRGREACSSAGTIAALPRLQPYFSFVAKPAAQGRTATAG